MVEFEFDAAEARLVCRFDGRMDAAVSEQIRASVDAKVTELLSAHAEKLTVVFDVEKVAYVASSYLRICLAVAQKLGAGRFSVRGTNPTLKKIFLVAGLDSAFPIG